MKIIYLTSVAMIFGGLYIPNVYLSNSVVGIGIVLFTILIYMLYIKKESYTDNIKKKLSNAGYDFSVAIATKEEIENGAACGQLAIITENENKHNKDK